MKVTIDCSDKNRTFFKKALLSIVERVPPGATTAGVLDLK